MQVDQTVRPPHFRRDPERARKLQAPTIGEAEVLPLGLDALVVEEHGPEFVLVVRESGRPDDVLPELVVLPLQVREYAHWANRYNYYCC